MELRHLRYLVAVAECGSLSIAASKRLYTSQPSLSRQIQDMEAQVGTPLFVRTPRGMRPTAAGDAFLVHARVAIAQVDAAIEAARRAARPAKRRLAIGFLTGEEMTWLPGAMHVLRAELPDIEVTVSSDYSPDLAAAVAQGTLDVALMRAEPAFDLAYRVIAREPLIVLMPSDHRLTARTSIRPRDLAGEPFITMGGKAGVLRAVVDGYLKRAKVTVTPTQSVDNPAMVMSLIASTRGISLLPAYVENLMPWSVTSRPLAGPPATIDLVVGHDRSNDSPVLQLFLSRVDAMVARLGGHEAAVTPTGSTDSTLPLPLPLPKTPQSG